MAWPEVALCVGLLSELGDNRLHGKDPDSTLVCLAQNAKTQIEPTLALVEMLNNGQSSEQDADLDNYV
jgi:hypothetical protein